MKQHKDFNLKLSDLHKNKNKKPLSLYTVDSKYYRKLREADSENVLFLKQRRPFVGVVLTCNNRIYFAPCTSPKERYCEDNQDRTFLLIDNGKYGAIRFDSMVPIPLKYVKEFNYNKISIYDEAKKFQEMQKCQLHWINKNEKIIKEKAAEYFMSYRKNLLTESEKKHSVNLKKVNKIFDEVMNIHKKNPQNIYKKENNDREFI